MSEVAFLVVQPRNTLSAGAKKPTVTLKSSAPLAFDVVEFLITIHTELKKDPGVPRLPNLRVCSAEKQRRRSVCPPYLPHLPLIFNTISRIPLSVSPTGPPARRRNDGVRAHALFACPARGVSSGQRCPVCPVRLDLCSCDQDEGTATEALHPHAAQSRRRGRCCPSRA